MEIGSFIKRAAIFCFLFLCICTSPVVASLEFLYFSAGVSARWAHDFSDGTKQRHFHRDSGPTIGLECTLWQTSQETFDSEPFPFYIEPGIEFNTESASLKLYAEIGTGAQFVGIGSGPFWGWSFKERCFETGIQSSVWAGFIVLFAEGRGRLYFDAIPEKYRMFGSPSIGFVGKLPIFAPII